MNKVFNINLGAYPFTIDEDAYKHLSRYLETISRHFQDSDGHEEIVNDIEARMAELFQEKLGNRPIVTIKDVKEAILIMGTPEEFGADPMDEEAASTDSSSQRTKTSSKKSSNFKIKTGKRLFRNPEEEVVGGVCSGIAAYFGVEDPLWVRLAFIVLTIISAGVAIPLYIVLWAILPSAVTAGDRLAMRGEPINVSNIVKIIEEEVENLSTKVTEFGEEFGSSKSNKKKTARRKKKRTEASVEDWYV